MHAIHLRERGGTIGTCLYPAHDDAAIAIEQLIDENKKLRAQLTAFQKAATTASTQQEQDQEPTHTHPLKVGQRVRLTTADRATGVVIGTTLGDRGGVYCTVKFDSQFQQTRNVKAEYLELATLDS
ncbi:hypothetical protein V8I69_003894 [Salmonella enterica]